MLYKELLEEEYCKTVEELKNVNCVIDPVSGKVLHESPSIAEIMESYSTSSCFFFWRLIAQYFSPQVNILESKIKLYAKVQIPTVKEEVKEENSPSIYAILPYYEYANMLKLYPDFAVDLQKKLLTVADANIVLKFTVPKTFLSDYKAILSSRYSTVSSEYLNLSTSLSVANQVCSRQTNMLEQWKRISEVLKVDLDDLIANGEVFPRFNIEKETFILNTSKKAAVHL